MVLVAKESLQITAANPIAVTELGFQVMPERKHPSAFSGSTVLQGLTLDNPGDVDWYSFQVAAPTQLGDFLRILGVSPTDKLAVALYNEAAYRAKANDNDPDTNPEETVLINLDGAVGPRLIDLGSPSLKLAPNITYLLKVSSNAVPTIYEIGFLFLSTPDRADAATGTATGNNTADAAFDLGALASLFTVTGLSLHQPEDVDWYRFDLEYPFRSIWTVTADAPQNGRLTSDASFTVTLSSGGRTRSRCSSRQRTEPPSIQFRTKPSRISWLT